MNEVNEQHMDTSAPKKPNTTVWVVGIILVGLMGLLLFKNMQNKPADTMKSTGDSEVQIQNPTTSMAPATEAVENQAMMAADDSEVKVIKMDMGAFYYSPNTITVKKGQKVRIELTSKDMMHDFNIDQLGVKSPIVKAGDTATVEFVASQVGEFEYYCSVGQHRKNGQIGTLIVEE